MKFVAEGVARPTAAVSAGTSALNHELRDHTVKYQAVIIFFLLLLASPFVDKFLRAFCQPDKILDRFGRFFFEESYYDISLRSFKNGVGSCDSAHSLSL